MLTIFEASLQGAIESQYPPNFESPRKESLGAALINTTRAPEHRALAKSTQSAVRKRRPAGHTSKIVPHSCSGFKTFLLLSADLTRTFFLFSFNLLSVHHVYSLFLFPFSCFSLCIYFYFIHISLFHFHLFLSIGFMFLISVSSTAVP